MLRTVRATRYVTPLREGGSLPAIVEADDLGLYVVKFRGAGQGALALVAEIIAGEIARSLGLPVPELVFVEIDESLGRNEPDYEIRELLKASLGRNVGLDYLPGSVTFDPAAGDKVDPELASQIVWFDSFIVNVDRTPRNANALLWHKKLYLIDHGAALYFHHNWQSAATVAHSKFAPIGQHILLPAASLLPEAAAYLTSKITAERLQAIVATVPPEWIAPAQHAAYVEFFQSRLAASPVFVEEALRARNELI
jgi:hypothetical protein